MHSGGFELTKLTYTRLEANLIRHRVDRLYHPSTPFYLYCGTRRQTGDLTIEHGEISTVPGINYPLWDFQLDKVARKAITALFY